MKLSPYSLSFVVGLTSGVLILVKLQLSHPLPGREGFPSYAELILEPQYSQPSATVPRMSRIAANPSRLHQPFS